MTDFNWNQDQDQDQDQAERPSPSKTHVLWPKDRVVSEEDRRLALDELRRSWEDFRPGDAYLVEPCEVGDLVGYRAVPK